MSACEEPLPSFTFEKAPGLIVTERDLDAMPWSRDRKLAEAKRCRDLWDGFRIGMRPVEDDSERGFHWEET